MGASILSDRVGKSFSVRPAADDDVVMIAISSLMEKKSISLKLIK